MYAYMHTHAFNTFFKYKPWGTNIYLKKILAMIKHLDASRLFEPIIEFIFLSVTIPYEKFKVAYMILEVTTKGCTDTDAISFFYQC